jgi:hypothetical protein
MKLKRQTEEPKRREWGRQTQKQNEKDKQSNTNKTRKKKTNRKTNRTELDTRCGHGLHLKVEV